MGHPVGVLKRTSRDARSDFLPGDHMVIWQHSMPAGRSLTPMMTECRADSALGNSVQSARLRLISARVTFLAMVCKAILSKCIKLSKLESIFTGGIVIPKFLCDRHDGAFRQSLLSGSLDSLSSQLPLSKTSWPTLDALACLSFCGCSKSSKEAGPGLQGVGGCHRPIAGRKAEDSEWQIHATGRWCQGAVI